MVYASFNLQKINAPVPPKWKHNDHILEKYKKFHHSCQCIFDGPMAHVMSGKVKTNMFFIWCGSDREDIYDNFQLDDDEMYDIDYIMNQFEQYCEPICNFRAARYKFCQVSQCENEMTNAFYYHIQKLCIQCQFSDDQKHLVDAIIYGTKVQIAREKLLQRPKHLTLCDCLKVCHHYELLQYNLNVVKLMDKLVESITKHHFNRGGRQQSGSKKSSTFRSQPSDKPSNSANTVLHRAPIEHNVCTEWYTVQELEPIPSDIINHCIQMEANILTDWNVDALSETTPERTIHLIEIDSVASDSVYTHVTLNDEVCHAKLDTGVQINVMTESLFKCIGKVNKLPLFSKSDMKLVGYSNRNIEYIGTTVLNVAHLNQTKKVTFYVTKLNDDKVILGLQLCIDLLLLSIHCDDKCQCKSHVLHETKKIGSEFPVGVDLQQTKQDIFPPVPISTKLDSDDVKQQVMDMYPDLFSSVEPVVCSPCHVPHTIQPKLKDKLDRMLKLGVIRKLDINEASDWVHLVIMIKPNGKLCVCLDLRTFELCTTSQSS